MSTANDLFSLPAGSLLQMQATVPENAPRYSARMIGSLPGSSLIVTTPTVDGKVQIVREGQRFNIRVLKGERVLGFVAQVMHAALKPYPHLHLEYPTEFEQIVVRNASRVSTRVDCLVRNTAETGDEQVFRPAQFVDLSETGAKIASDGALGEVGAVLHVKFQVEVSGVVEEMGLLAEVRNLTERTETSLDGDRSVVYSGVQFRTLSRYQQVLLHAWVTNQVLQSALRSQRS